MKHFAVHEAKALTGFNRFAPPKIACEAPPQVVFFTKNETITIYS